MPINLCSSLGVLGACKDPIYLNIHTPVFSPLLKLCGPEFREIRAPVGICSCGADACLVHALEDLSRFLNIPGGLENNSRYRQHNSGSSVLLPSTIHYSLESFLCIALPDALAVPGVLGFTEFCLYPLRGCYILIPLTFTKILI